MLGNYRVAKQLLDYRVVLSSIELVSYSWIIGLMSQPLYTRLVWRCCIYNLFYLYFSVPAAVIGTCSLRYGNSLSASTVELISNRKEYLPSHFSSECFLSALWIMHFKAKLLETESHAVECTPRTVTCCRAYGKNGIDTKPNDVVSHDMMSIN
jgi:hypothetical protein